MCCGATHPSDLRLLMAWVALRCEGLRRIGLPSNYKRVHYSGKCACEARPFTAVAGTRRYRLINSAEDQSFPL